MAKIKTYVKVYMPGAFMAEDEVFEVPSREIDQAGIPEDAVSFYFYDIVEGTLTVNGEKYPARTAAINKSPYYYVGKAVSQKQVLAERGADSMLYKNLISNKKEYAIISKGGRCMHMINEDELQYVVSPDALVKPNTDNV